ncbi:hypothetical protein NFJ02_13g14250 [Pycnococcus provasolii]
MLAHRKARKGTKRDWVEKERALSEKLVLAEKRAIAAEMAIGEDENDDLFDSIDEDDNDETLHIKNVHTMAEIKLMSAVSTAMHLASEPPKRSVHTLLRQLRQSRA